MNPEEIKNNNENSSENSSQGSTSAINDKSQQISDDFNSPKLSKPKTEKINVEDLAEEDPNMIEVSWGKEPNSFFKGPTEPAKEAPKVNNNPSSQSSSEPNPASGAKFKTGISILVEVLDWIMSEILAKISGTHKPSSYTAEPQSKENLKEALGMILEEARKAIPTWLVLLFAFLSCYGFGIMDAIRERKKSKENKDVKKEQPSTHSLEPGIFERNGIKWRRYANGSEYPCKYDTQGNEILRGQPPKRNLRRAA